MEGGKLKYYYYLNKGGKNVAYVIGRREPDIPIFTVEQLFSAPETSKRATVVAFNELLPRVEQDLQKEEFWNTNPLQILKWRDFCKEITA